MFLSYQTDPIRTELELDTYGRDYFASWGQMKEENLSVIRTPVGTFIDGFGVFRNSYRWAIGVYQTLEGLDAFDFNRLANKFPITLGPQRSLLPKWQSENLKTVRIRLSGPTGHKGIREHHHRTR